MNVPAILAIVAGAVFIYQGFQETGLMGMIRRSLTRVLGSSTKSDKLTAASASCGAGLLFAPFFRGQGHTGALIAGVCTGFLPCGLLYGMLTLAASTHHVLWGGATMLAFGLGTLPLMVLVGTTGQLLSLVSRRYLFAAAAWCLILTGAISLGRGIGHLSWSDRPATGCPLCTAQQVAE